jgi:quercetin dioxygenase-like cupin family protein
LHKGVASKTFWGDKMLLSLVEFDPGSEGATHSHSHEQAGVVIEGEIEFTIGEVKQLLKPGDCYVIPSDVEHSATATGIGCKMMTVFSPVREDYKY